jgi:hypothetical protein
VAHQSDRHFAVVLAFRTRGVALDGVAHFRVHAYPSGKGLEAVPPTMVRGDQRIFDSESPDPFSQLVADRRVGRIFPAGLALPFKRIE